MSDFFNLVARGVRFDKKRFQRDFQVFDVSVVVQVFLSVLSLCVAIRVPPVVVYSPEVEPDALLLCSQSYN